MSEDQEMLLAMLEVINEIRTDLACLPEMKAQLGSLQWQVSGLQTQVHGLQQNLTDFRGEVNERFDRVETDLAFHHAKLVEHDRAIGELKQKQI